MSPQNADLAAAAREAADAVRDFLIRHGGLSNGYVTWAKGDNKHVTWETARSGDMTVNEMKRSCRAELLPALARVIETHGAGIELVIESTHMEHGCYRTDVSAVLKCTVRAVW